MKKKPLWLKIIFGIILGIIYGVIAVRLDLGKFTYDWIKPWGVIFIKLLKLIAVPIIFVSLVKGITSVSNLSSLSRIGVKTFMLYLISTFISIVIGLIMVNYIKPGEKFPDSKREELHSQFILQTQEKEKVADNAQSKSPLYFIEEIVPDNIFLAATDNSKMLQIIFFSILFATSIIVIGKKQVSSVTKLIDDINGIMIKMVDFIMKVSPLGVFSLISVLVVDFSGDTGIFVSLASYSLLVVCGLLGLLFILYPLMIKLFTKVGLKRFFNALLPVQMVAFSTSSSAATLPVTLKQTVNKLGVSEDIANFVLPVGVTINMNGASFYQAVSTVFICQVYGIDLTLAQQIMIVLTATLASIRTPGVPGGAVIMLIIVLSSVGVPAEGLSLIIGLERPLDMIRTAVNVTGDAAVSAIVAESENKIDYSPDRNEMELTT